MKLHHLIPTLAAVLSAALLTGCAPADDTVYMSGKSAVNGHNIYFLSGFDAIHYMNFDSGITGVFCFDPLCEHNFGDCPAVTDHPAEMIHNITSTKPNTVWYTKKDYDDKIEVYEYKIIEYNAETGKFKVILEGAEDLITQFVVRGDTIYYFMNGYGENRKWIRNIYKYFIKNQKSECMTEDMEENILFGGYDDNGNVYLREPDLGVIYRTDWSFENIEEVKRVNNGHNYTYIHGGYLYYFTKDEGEYKKEWTRIIDGVPREDEDKFWYYSNYCNLVRVPLDDLDSPPETVAKNVYATQNSRFVGNKILCLEPRVEYYHSIKTDEGYKDLYTTSGDWFFVDLETFERTTAMPYMNYEISDIQYCDKNMLVGEGRYLDVENMMEADNNHWVTIKYEFATGKITVLDEPYK